MKNHPYNENFLFVFGSNEAGIHGGGAAKWAKDNLGAQWGKGFGISGYTFAFPTKDRNIQTLSKEKIKEYFVEFFKIARENPQIGFNLTPVGCGLAGYKKNDIFDVICEVDDLIEDMPQNIFFDARWFNFHGG